MAFTTGRQDITPLRGTDSYIIICEQLGWDKPDETGHWPSYDPSESFIDTESGDHIRPYPFQPQASNIGIVRQGTTIDASYFKGTPIHSKDGEGPAMVSGDLTFNVSGNGTGQILRAVLQDRAPVATEVASTTETSILGATTLTGTASTTSFTDDLADLPVPVRITATLSASAELGAGESRADITIMGKNRRGETRTAILRWTATDLPSSGQKTLTKTTTMYFHEIDSVEPDGNFAGTSPTYSLDYQRPVTTNLVASSATLEESATDTPATLTGDASTFGTPTPQTLYLKLSGATLATNIVFGYVNITGTDTNNRVITDRVRFMASDVDDVKQTTAYFKTVTRVTSQGFSAGTFRIDAVNQATNVTFTPSTALPVFWAIEAGKGNRPNTYRNVIPNSTSINFSREEPVRVVCSVMGGYAELGQALSGVASPTQRTRLNFTSEDVFSGWECNITIGGVELAAQSATLTINHNLEDSGLLGGKYPTAPPSGAGEREIILTVEMQTDDENDFRDIYDSNLTLNDVQAQLRNVSHGAFPHQLQFQFPTMQITDDPDFVVNDFGIVGQTLSLRGIFTPGLAYEFRILANYSVWYPVREYAA